MCMRCTEGSSSHKEDVVCRVIIINAACMRPLALCLWRPFLLKRENVGITNMHQKYKRQDRDPDGWVMTTR